MLMLQKGSIEIILPPFIAYETSRIITLKKVDDSKHSVTVKAKNFTITLHKLNENLKVQWAQPFYLNGEWRVVNRPLA